MHIQKFEPNINPLKSKNLQHFYSQNQHQSPSCKPTNPSKHKIRSKLETHQSPPSFHTVWFRFAMDEVRASSAWVATHSSHVVVNFVGFRRMAKNLVFCLCVSSVTVILTMPHLEAKEFWIEKVVDNPKPRYKDLCIFCFWTIVNFGYHGYLLFG